MGDFTMPSLGADMEAGTLVEWRIKPGDTVRRGDIVALVETQKGVIEVEIFEDGKVESLLVEPGMKVPVGAVLARLEGGGIAEAAKGASATAAAPGAGPAVVGAQPLSTGPGAPLAGAAPVAGAGAVAGAVPVAGEVRIRASPAARTAARELGVDLGGLQGTGPGGAISRGDVERAASAAKPAPGPRTGMRQAISAAMSRSKREIPHYYLSTQVDLGRALEWLRAHNEPLKPGERLLPLVLLLKAVGRGLRKVPELNGFYESGVFRPCGGVHLGVAISLREGGLVVPALHDVDTKPMDQLGRELTDLIERSRRGQLRSSELADATLTVTSLGERGVEEVYGVIFPPQVALVGFGRIFDAPRVIEGRCVARPTVIATLAADHRVSDGHRGGVYLSEIAALLQTPEAL